MLEPIIEDIITTRKKTLDTYATPNLETPGAYDVPAANREIVLQELTALDAVETEVQLVKIKLDDLANVELSVQTMDSLYPLIEEES